MKVFTLYANKELIMQPVIRTETNMNFTHSLLCAIPQSHLSPLTQIKEGHRKNTERNTRKLQSQFKAPMSVCEMCESKGEMKRVMREQRERVNEEQP